MKMFQRAGKNSVSVQAGGSIVANALGKGSTVVSGTGNHVAGPGAHGNVFADSTGRKYKAGSRGHNQIQVGDLKIETSGNHIMLQGVEDDAIVTVNGKQVWPQD